MAEQIRTLTEVDRARVEAFLIHHRDSSMFLRSNIRHAGLTYHGKPSEAVYLAAIEAGEITGLIARTWNGIVQVQAPAHAEALARALAAAAAGAISGITGPREQVRRVQAALGLVGSACRADFNDDLFALSLDALCTPMAAHHELVCRPPLTRELDELVEWRVAYEREVLGAEGEADAARRRKIRSSLAEGAAAGHVWIGAHRDELVSLSMFNAALPDSVQLGGIYTPPAQRGRHYARHVIGAHLVAAQAGGVERAVLFTDNPSAVACYQALGFRKVGEIVLVLLRAGGG